MNGDDLRRRLATGDPVLMPGVWDAMSARLCVQAGHEVAFLSGYCTSATLLGLPDFGYLTQGEMAEVARRVCGAASDLMVIVDADTGYGNPLNTIRTVELWEAAGATGMFLEDQVWPKKCGHMAGKEVVPVEDWLSKLQAAVATRTSLHITARTDARAAVSLDEAIDRARRALDVGVDAVFVEAPESLEELEQIAEALPDCVRVANMIETGKTPLLTPSELHDLGFDLIVSPLGALYAAAQAIRDVYATLAEKGTLRDDLDGILSFDEFNALVDLDEHYERENRHRWVPGGG
jgi:2,3-dimethylmalate lyase